MSEGETEREEERQCVIVWRREEERDSIKAMAHNTGFWARLLGKVNP